MDVFSLIRFSFTCDHSLFRLFAILKKSYYLLTNIFIHYATL